MDIDKQWMQRALTLAEKASNEGEVPIGALMINDQNECIAEAYNQTVHHNDPCAHAEILVIRKAAHHFDNYRLVNTTLYVTLEPCMMCAGAIIQARIPRVVFGAPDIRSGAVVSVFNVLDHPSLNHSSRFTANVLAEESIRLLQTFFQARRG